MHVNEELNLLIKSKHPIIVFETTDEVYAIKQLSAITQQLNFLFFEWSLTDGLRKYDTKDTYYQTKDAAGMLRMVKFLLGRIEDLHKPMLFALKDFEKYLDNTLIVRLFKDIINLTRGTKNTFVIISAEYKIPKDIESDSVHLIGGQPDEGEIGDIIKETIEDVERTRQEIKLLSSPEEFKKIVNALKGLSMQQIRNVINQCIIEDNILNIKDIKVIEAYKKKVFDQEGLLEFYISEDKNNIAGFDNLKRWLSERKNSFSSEAPVSLPIPKGLLLMGVQGCGKSLAVKIIARELNLPLYRLDLGRIYSKYIGETEQNLEKVMTIAEKLCPVCLWIDEIEKGFAHSGGDIDGGVSQRILSTFLTWMQERKSTCFLAATANNIYQLPPEFLRKGRFDEIFFVDLPDEKSREHVLKIHLKKRGLEERNFDLKKITNASSDFSGAEIEQAIISALYRASTEKKNISTEHIIEQIKSTKPLSVLKGEEIAALRLWSRERTIPA